MSAREPDLAQRVRAAVDGDEHRPEVADVRAHHAEVGLVARPPRDDERVPVAEPGAERRHVDPGRERRPPPRGGGRACSRRTPRARARRGSAARRAPPAGRPPRAPSPRRAASRSARSRRPRSAAGRRPRARSKSARAGRVDQPDPRADELERPGVREPPGRRGRDVDDGADARLGELLGGDAVDVGVVDDRDVVRARGA